jgi:hypothetical protein
MRSRRVSQVGLQLRLRLFVVLGDLSLQLFLEFRDQGVALGLGMFLRIEAVRQIGADFLFQRVIVGLVELRRRDRPLFLARLGAQLVERGADLFDLGVAEFDRVDHHFFADFFRAGLDHHDSVGGSDDHDVQQALTHLVVGGIDDESPADLADAHCADGPQERNVRKGERSRCSVDAENIGIIISVGREHEGDDLGLALESVGKHGTHGPVDLAAGEHFALAHAAFALDEAAGKASTGVGVFAVIHGEGEEIDALAGFGVRGRGGEHDIFSNADHGRAMSLLG